MDIDGGRRFGHPVGMSTETITEAVLAAPPSDHWMTTEEFLALPENNEVERWLLGGRLIERPMTRRSFSHSRTLIRIGQMLQNWLDQQPAPRGMVVGGEAGFRLTRNPDFTVGVDVAYISAEQAAATSKRAFLIDGPPVLAVEILSPSDRNDDITDKVWGYIDAGVKLVWRVEPVVGLVTVFRPDAEPEGINIHGHLTGDPHLPGFRVAVADIFA